jgi:4-oxalocrotonate tautomerase
MPFVEVKSIRGVFSTEEKPKIIKEITDVFARMKGDEFAAGTWVVVNELDDGNWGEGGNKAKHNCQRSWVDLLTACSGLCLRRYVYKIDNHV